MVASNAKRADTDWPLTLCNLAVAVTYAAPGVTRPCLAYLFAFGTFRHNAQSAGMLLGGVRASVAPLRPSTKR
eukprot:95573-Pyramimonas_sp.AAC.1